MRYETFLVSIHNGPTVPVGGQAEPDKARQVFERMRDDPEQGRKGMVWDTMLAEAALLKCKKQAREGWTGHVSPEGVGPNKFVRMYTTYKLPGYPHDDAANTVESLADNGDGSLDGIEKPEHGVWPAWMGSKGHREHILGLNNTFAAQTQVGVGYYEGGKYHHYWCVLTVRPEN